MKKLLIGDCHFGVKSNSIIWLDQQLTFFRTQVFDILKNGEIGEVIFLGDLTDIRYSVEQQVGIELKKLIREMVTKFSSTKFYFIAGNHDYFSPLEEFIEYNSYELLFGEEFVKCHPNVKLITNEPLLTDDGCLMLPWYWTENTDHFDEMLYMFDIKHNVNAIFCHADLSCWPGARIASLHGKPVYSGHIHFIIEDEIGNLHNLGATFPLTFNDVNQDRFIYIMDENFKIVDKIKNITTFRFIRIYNEQIFNAEDDIFRNSYVQLCISQSNINQAKYIDQVKYLKSTYIDSNIAIHIIDDEELRELQSLPTGGFQVNISGYIENNIPNHLNNKFEKIKSKLQE